MIADQHNLVNAAFSKQSDIFDRLEENNPIIQWMRNIIRQHLLQYVKPGMHMLELNAGTGLDAVYFAQKGIHVYATDISDGMIQQLKKKLADFQLHTYLKIQQCSYSHLQQIEGEKFDHIFSNFGGLNCIPDLHLVTRHFDKLLKVNGLVTFVIMPRICPWEILSALKGKFKMAFRRFKKNGTQAHVEGVHFDTWYFNKPDIINAFGKSYVVISIKGIASISPPPDREKWFKKHLKFYRLLTRIDELLMNYYPFNSCADHILITMKKLS